MLISVDIGLQLRTDGIHHHHFASRKQVMQGIPSKWCYESNEVVVFIILNQAMKAMHPLITLELKPAGEKNQECEVVELSLNRFCYRLFIIQ